MWALGVGTRRGLTDLFTRAPCADRVQGGGEGTGQKLPYPNEPVEEPPPLPPAQLAPYLATLLQLLQPGETVPAALR